MKPSKSLAFITSVSVFVLWGCTGLYFKRVKEAPGRPLMFSLDQWPFKEYWAGIIFNGKKIGFTHLKLQQSGQNHSEFEISSEAFLAFRFWMVDKTVTLKSRDWVGRDLQLHRFDYDFMIDNSHLQRRGSVQAGELQATVRSSNGTE